MSTARVETRPGYFGPVVVVYLKTTLAAWRGEN
jgi:hypothetical protein